jgi:hypothetical protein
MYKIKTVRTNLQDESRYRFLITSDKEQHKDV